MTKLFKLVTLASITKAKVGDIQLYGGVGISACEKVVFLWSVQDWLNEFWELQLLFG